MKVAAALATLFVGCTGRTVLMTGDSWADYLGIPNRVFPEVFEENNDPRTVKNIAIAGSTCRQWADWYLEDLKDAAKDPSVEIVWLTCGGNDALLRLPFCPDSQQECIGKVTEEIKRDMVTIYYAVMSVNPFARVVSFGYDIMGFGGLICGLVPRLILPECDNDPFCVNSILLSIQIGINEVAAHHSNYDSVNLLGSLQEAHCVPGAYTGNPVLSRFSPGYDPSCIHPTKAGYKTIFTNFYTRYFKGSSEKFNATHFLPAIPVGRSRHL
eukprot:TRINITY_DN1439_c1_g1_i1.p1 TRINITY_DN1439_c1_g1~~TRINITY_DN1439_c1_g1_i1.p1  ORF type:complete len:287 (+),score=33.76 TRINITY_DN1439_c1_g1_i1:55-861(+)